MRSKQCLKRIHVLFAQRQTDNPDNHNSSVGDADGASNSIRTGSPNFNPNNSAAPPYPVPVAPMQIAISNSPMELNMATGSPGMPSTYVTLMRRMSLLARRMSMKNWRPRPASLKSDLSMSVMQFPRPST